MRAAAGDQGVQERQLLPGNHQPVAAAGLLGEDVAPVPRSPEVFLQPADGKPGVDRSRHHLAHRVGELDGDVRGGRQVGVGVGARLLEAAGSAAAVGEAELERIHPVDHRVQRVELDQHQPAARPQGERCAAHPRIKVADPTEHAVGGEGHVEAPGQLAG
jgi:hypothetical protein